MLHEADLDAYAEMLGDVEVMRYIGEGKPAERWEAWRNLAMMLGHWQLRGYGLWAVEERASGQFVGRVGFWNPDGWPGFEIGWMLRRACWGRGYATEAARAALRVGFTQMEQQQVLSLIRPENHASIRVALRLGERLDGQTDIGGRPALVYRLTRIEWKSGEQSG
jgi:RimJ/RimL family protein N-acetyltransferase